jgi:hypothetical protein
MTTTYHGQQTIKDRYIARVKAHRSADLLQKGATGNPAMGQKGCAVACTMNRYDHYAYPGEIGVPMCLAYLEDAIFEGLPVEDAMRWPEEFLEAIPVGADPWPAIHRIPSRILLEVGLPSALAVEPKGPSADAVEKAIRDIAALHIDAASGKVPSVWRAWQDAWDKTWLEPGQAAGAAAWAAAWAAARAAARDAARAAAWAAARAAARTAARDAARTAARSAAESARAAAWAATESAAESARAAAWAATESAAESARAAAWAAAGAAAYQKMRDIALEELRGLPA